MKVCFPFTYVRSAIIWSYLLFHIAYMVIVNFTYYVFEVYITKEMGEILQAMQDACFWSYFLHCILGVAASVTTVAYLMLSQRDNASQKKKYYNSCIVLMYMNVPYIVTAISIIYLIWGALEFGF